MTASTDIAPFNASFGGIDNIVNGSGLSSLSLTATHSQATEFNGWASVTNASTGNFTFNLNGLYNLAGFSVWNWNNNTNFGINGVNILTSTDGSNFTTVTGAPTQFARGVNQAAAAPQQFSFSAVDAAYVRFSVQSNQGSGIGLAEVQFDGTTAATSVPEPFTIVGTLVGLGSGAALKRRLKAIESKSV